MYVTNIWFSIDVNEVQLIVNLINYIYLDYISFFVFSNLGMARVASKIFVSRTTTCLRFCLCMYSFRCLVYFIVFFFEFTTFHTSIVFTTFQWRRGFQLPPSACRVFDCMCVSLYVGLQIWICMSFLNSRFVVHICF